LVVQLINFKGKGENIMSVPYVIEKDEGQERVYDLYSRLLKDRIIFIRGLIDQDLADSVVAQLLFLESLDKESDIHLYINTPGGRIDSMYSIYDTMNIVSPDITTLGMGTVASAGTFLIAAGVKGKRYTLENTSFMIHEMTGGMSGKYNIMKNEFKHMETLYDRMSKHYVKLTGQKLSKICSDMQKDYYMSAEEAKKYGLIDKIQHKRN
jgi:ATP-dependent Clp protease protease subunit